MALVFNAPKDLLKAVGEKAGPTDWVAVTQNRINQFADATGDYQWIHVDETRAKDGPFGATIAHGYLTLALANCFLPGLVRVENSSMGLNYGCDKVRFPGVVKAGERVRGRAEIVNAEEIKGSVQSTVRIAIEKEGGDRPVCVVDTISRYYP